MRANIALGPIRRRRNSRVTVRVARLLDASGSTVAVVIAVMAMDQAFGLLVFVLGARRAGTRGAAAAAGDAGEAEGDGREEKGGDGAPHQTESDVAELGGLVVVVEMVAALDVVGTVYIFFLSVSISMSMSMSVSESRLCVVGMENESKATKKQQDIAEAVPRRKRLTSSGKPSRIVK